MRISVISLVYNNYEGLLATAKSVLMQRCENFEYIILDDGSEVVDKSAVFEIEELFINSGIPFEFVFSERNQGTVRAFNSAVTRTSGDFIVPLASGDLFCDDLSLDLLSRCFLEQDVNVITYNSFKYRREVGDLGNSIYPVLRDRKVIECNSDVLLDHLLLFGNIISGARTAYRKSFLIENKLFDINFRLIEDFPSYIKILNSGKSIFHFDKCLIHYQQGGVSTSGPNSALKRDYSKMYAVFKDTYNLDERRMKLFKVWSEFSLGSKIEAIRVSPWLFLRLVVHKGLRKL